MTPDFADKRRRMVASGQWTDDTVDATFRTWAAKQPELEAVADPPNRQELLEGEPRRLTYGELASEADRATVALHELGLRRNDVLVVQLPNCVEQFVIYLACARLGVIISPVPVQYREHELAHILRLSGAVAALMGEARSAGANTAMFLGLREAAPKLATLLSINREVPPGVMSLSARMDSIIDPTDASARLATAAAPGGDDIFSLCWTSGTEAQPKGVPRSHNVWFALGRLAVSLSRIQHGERMLNPFPLVNMAGFATSFFPWLIMGCTLVQHHPFKLPLYLQQLREDRIDFTAAPPAILTAMLHNEALVQGIDFKRLNRISSGASPLPPWMVAEFQRRWGVAIINNYGSNEGGVLGSSDLDVPDPEVRAECFQRPGGVSGGWRWHAMDHVDTRIVDPETGEDITQPGRPGELRFAGPTVFDGYIGDPALNERAFDERGFFRSGDLFEISGERGEYYRFVGRLKDIVIRGGMNISTEEVDSLLVAHPKITDAAVVGYPDDVLGEKVCACVVLKPGQTLTLPELADHMRNVQKVAVFKLPERLEILDQLPRNPVGKLLKRDLREWLRSKLAVPA